MLWPVGGERELAIGFAQPAEFTRNRTVCCGLCLWVARESWLSGDLSTAVKSARDLCAYLIWMFSL